MGTVGLLSQSIRLPHFLSCSCSGFLPKSWYEGVNVVLRCGFTTACLNVGACSCHCGAVICGIVYPRLFLCCGFALEKTEVLVDKYLLCAGLRLLKWQLSFVAIICAYHLCTKAWMVWLNTQSCSRLMASKWHYCYAIGVNLSFELLVPQVLTIRCLIGSTCEHGPCCGGLVVYSTWIRGSKCEEDMENALLWLLLHRWTNVFPWRQCDGARRHLPHWRNYDHHWRQSQCREMWPSNPLNTCGFSLGVLFMPAQPPWLTCNTCWLKMWPAWGGGARLLWLSVVLPHAPQVPVFLN